MRGRDLVRNLGWKVLAVVVAYLFWRAVIEERQAYRQLEVPVRFENLEPALALVRDRPSSVVVRVQAAEPVVKELQPLDIDARVDLAGLGQGTHVVRLLPGSAAILARKVGVAVTEVFPSAFEVRLEPKRTAEVPVKPSLVGTPAVGYEVESVRLEPSQARIEGPESAVRRTTEARTREISVEGRRASFQIESAVDVANPDVLIVAGGRTRVGIGIREAVGEKTFAEVPVAPLGAAYETRINPRHVRITVRGPVALLGGLTRDDLVAYVELGSLTPQAADYSLPVRVVFTRDVLRERMTVKAVSAENVSVRVNSRRLPGAGVARGAG